jgi:hypothetical protein
VDSSFEQPDMFPDLLPDIVVRIWRAHLRHYRTGTHKVPSREELVRYLEADPGKPASAATIDRARRQYPRLLPWPIRRGQQPPWLIDPSLLAEYGAPVEVPATDHVRLVAFDEHGGATALEVVADEHGILRLVSRWRDHSAAFAAGMVGTVMLDVMTDGRLDGIIRWCRILVKGIRPEI